MQMYLTDVDYMSWPGEPADARIHYASDDPNQFGDLYLPEQRPSGGVPVALMVHGGCWQSQYGLEPLGRACRGLSRLGCAVWSVEYRRVGHRTGGWPGTFIDVGRAADHLERLAESYRLDLTRVVTVGHSAGGHLALWLAARSQLSANEPLFVDKPQPIKGAVLLAGIPDLALAVEYDVCESAVQALIGGLPHEVPERYRAASPAERLPLGVPHILVQGVADQLVPVEYAQEYTVIAKMRGDRVELMLIDDTAHFEVVAVADPAWPVVVGAVKRLISH